MENKIVLASEGITSSERALHTPGSFAKEHLPYVQEVGRLKSITPHWCERENLESYLLLYVKAGKGVLKADQGTEYALLEGDLAWVDCRQAYGHCSGEEDPWELLWVHFDGVGVAAYYEFFKKANGSPVLHLSKADTLSDCLEQLRIVQAQKDIYGEFRSAQLLNQLMTTVVLEMKKREQKASQELFEGIRAYIAENYTHDNLMQEIQEKFASKEFDIQEEFRKRYGLELWDYILNRKFTVAKELLRFSVKPIAEIVTESGIRNTDLFYQLFKENEKMSPEEYRKKWAQWIK